MKKEVGIHKCYYVEERQAEWLKKMSELNNRPVSYFVRLAIDLLIEQVEGIPNGEV